MAKPGFFVPPSGQPEQFSELPEVEPTVIAQLEIELESGQTDLMDLAREMFANNPALGQATLRRLGEIAFVHEEGITPEELEQRKKTQALLVKEAVFVYAALGRQLASDALSTEFGELSDSAEEDLASLDLNETHAAAKNSRRLRAEWGLDTASTERSA